MQRHCSALSHDSSMTNGGSNLILGRVRALLWRRRYLGSSSLKKVKDEKRSLCACFFVMSVYTSTHFAAARQALKEAQKGICAEGCLSEADLESFPCNNAGFLAARQWLASAFLGLQTATKTSLVTTNATKLPLADCTATVPIFDCTDQYAVLLLECKMRAERPGRGAGGRKSFNETQEPHLQKKGPDSWKIKASSSDICCPHHMSLTRCM